MNNETLKQEIIIGNLEHPCTQPQFIASGEAFAYVTKDSKNNKFTLSVQFTNASSAIQVQSLDKEFFDYKFALDGKSFAYTCKKAPESYLKTVAGEEPIPQISLFLQKVNHKFQVLGDPQQLTPPDLNMYNRFVPSSYAWSPDSQRIAFTASQPLWKSQSQIKLYLIDVKERKLEKLDEGDGYLANLHFSSDGQKLAFMKGIGWGPQKIPLKPFKEEDINIHIVDLKTKEKKIVSIEDVSNIKGWKDENKKLVITKRKGTEILLYSLDLETNAISPIKIPNISCANQAIISKDQKYIGIGGENLHHPNELYISPLSPFNPKKITISNPAIDLSEIKAHSIKWKSFDGLEIEGILIYPQDYQKGKKAPLIVSIHGGPGGFDFQRFIGDTWFGSYSPAVFASLGYATLTVNYQGSIGYGAYFQSLDYKDLGGGDLKDILTGIDFLIAQGIADPDQLFIRGHSYGGFMTAWAVGQTNRFKAASIEAGIIDEISDSAIAEVPTGTERLLGGAYWENYELWRKTSPLSYVNNVETPTLILHGYKDNRVPPGQAKPFKCIKLLKKEESPLAWSFITEKAMVLMEF